MNIDRSSTFAENQLSIGQCATLACLLEVCAPKPGNVHRGADFADMGLVDFMASATAIGPVLERAEQQSVGTTMLAAVQATRRVTQANTNLGIILLIAPLAAVPRSTDLRPGVATVLEQLNDEDARQAFEAIRLVQPGGLKPRDPTEIKNDVRHAPQVSLQDAMQQAAAWDLIARQYVNEFEDVLERVLPGLLDQTDQLELVDRIVAAHVQLMAAIPDTLIARKSGTSVAQESAARASRVLEAGEIGSEAYQRALSDLDFWLRSSPGRNPGTSADLIAAALFAGLRDNEIKPPFGFC